MRIVLILCILLRIVAALPVNEQEQPHGLGSLLLHSGNIFPSGFEPSGISHLGKRDFKDVSMDAKVIDLTKDYQQFSSLAPTTGAWTSFQKLKDKKTVYMVNNLNDVSDHTELVNDDVRFLARDTYESVYWDRDEHSWFKQQYDMGIDVEDTEIDLEACLDNSMGDTASLSKSVSYGVDFTGNVAASVSLKIMFIDTSLLFDGIDTEFELSGSVSFKASASCDIGRGEFGRLYSILSVATTHPFTRTKMNFDGSKFVPAGEPQVVTDTVRLVTSSIPKTLCYRSQIPC